MRPRSPCAAAVMIPMGPRNVCLGWPPHVPRNHAGHWLENSLRWGSTLGWRPEAGNQAAREAPCQQLEALDPSPTIRSSTPPRSLVIASTPTPHSKQRGRLGHLLATNPPPSALYRRSFSGRAPVAPDAALLAAKAMDDTTNRLTRRWKPRFRFRIQNRHDAVRRLPQSQTSFSSNPGHNHWSLNCSPMPKAKDCDPTAALAFSKQSE